jgi:hypothetical protein
MNHELWDNNYIHSIFVTADPDEMEDLVLNVAKTVYTAKISFVGPREVTTFDVCIYIVKKNRHLRIFDTCININLY